MKVVKDLVGRYRRARLRGVGIDPERRPQTLSLAEWEALYEEFRSPEG